jgi:hypothetical protein
MVTAFAEAALGEVSRHAGGPDQARSLLTAARRRLDEATGVPPRIRLLPLTGLARLAAAGSRLAEARRLLAEALRLVLPGGPLPAGPLPVQDRPAIAGVAEALADLALADGRPADAARLLGYAAAVRGAPDRGTRTCAGWRRRRGPRCTAVIRSCTFRPGTAPPGTRSPS